MGKSSSSRDRRYQTDPEYRQKILDQNKEYRLKNKEKIAKKRVEWELKNKDHLNKYYKDWKEENYESFQQYHQEYNSRPDVKARNTEYWTSPEALRRANERRATPEVRKQIREQKAARRKSDLNYRLSDILRSRLYSAVKNGQKAGSAVRDLGCSIPEFVSYIAERFYPHPETGLEMSWKNYGFDTWHLDHIVPLASFDLTDREQFKKACHYTNIQPLWAIDNLKKSDKVLNE